MSDERALTLCCLKQPKLEVGSYSTPTAPENKIRIALLSEVNQQRSLPLQKLNFITLQKNNQKQIADQFKTGWKFPEVLEGR